MKLLNIPTLTIPFVALISFTLIGCSSGDDHSSDNGNKIINTSNINSNLEERNPYTHRIEFPRIKGGRSIIVTHSLENGEVNYCLEWDTEKKSNRWTCYQMYADNSTARTSRWYGNPQYPFDPSISSSYMFSTDHYYGTGYDHGHLCPSGDRLNTKEANIQTFYISNMQPQLKKFNGSDKGGGIWLTMENKIRSALNKNSNDTLFICRGGTIDRLDQIKEKRKDGFIVPGYFFSAAYMKYYNKYLKKWEHKAIGFWFKHENNQGVSLKPYVVNIDQLEQLTGIDFFCNLPDDIENKIESLDRETIITVWNIL